MIFLGFIGYVLVLRIPSMLSKSLSKSFQVSVTMQDLSLSFHHVDIEQFAIANLPNQKLRTALQIQHSHVTAPLTEYTKEHIVIEEISLDNVYLGLEFDSAKSTKGNWSVLMQHLENSTSATHDKTVLIRKLIITNLTVEVAYLGKDGSRKTLPVIDRLELFDIQNDQGIPTEQILHSILGQMLKSVFIKENLKNMLDTILKVPNKSLDTLLSPLKGLFGG